MATRKTDFVAEHDKGDYWEIWTDLTTEEIKTIEGVVWIFGLENPYDVRIDKRYSADEVIAEIKALAEVKAGQVIKKD